MKRTDYVSKAMNFLGGEEFVQLEEDPTRSFQDKVQRTLLGMKTCDHRFNKSRDKVLKYPTKNKSTN